MRGPRVYRARRPDAVVTSTIVTERDGYHREVRIWIRHQCAGDLIVNDAELAAFLELLDVGHDPACEDA